MSVHIHKLRKKPKQNIITRMIISKKMLLTVLELFHYFSFLHFLLHEISISSFYGHVGEKLQNVLNMVP